MLSGRTGYVYGNADNRISPVPFPFDSLHVLFNDLTSNVFGSGSGFLALCLEEEFFPMLLHMGWKLCLLLCV
jgi:hypothetical protein